MKSTRDWDGGILKDNTETIERLKDGETVLSDIVFSERMGNLYCIDVDVPVMKEDELVGTVQAVISAEALVSTELYDPGQGEVIAVFLTDGGSKILPASKEGGWGVGERLLDYLKKEEIDPKALKELQEVYQSEDPEARSIRIGSFDGSPYYLSMAGLKYNDWYLVVCLKADTVAQHFQYIIRNMAGSIASLIAAVILSSAVLVIFLRKIQKNFSREEKRYLLLERFSDTVLFDYDCRHDTIRFTSNASKLMRIHDLTQRNFLAEVNNIYIYAGDHEEVVKLLNGNKGRDTGEVRIRLIRPDVNEYFWCLVQYQNIYEGEKLDSIIGKITDIDERIRTEDYMLRMSETDGLTGLLNKASTKKQVEKRLKKTPEGLLFLINIDDLKGINDRYGRAAGDLALRFLGECMIRTFRSSDILGRTGGDELLAFIENVSSREVAQKKAELLEKHLELCTVSGIPAFTVSIGIVRFPQDGVSYTELTRGAELALCYAKNNGKKQFVFYEYIHDS